MDYQKSLSTNFFTIQNLKSKMVIDRARTNEKTTN